MAYNEKQIENTFNHIIERIENGESLRSILMDSDMPSSRTFFKWLNEDDQKVKQYARATELRSEIIFDELLHIADTPVEGIVIETDDNGRTKEKKGDMLGHRRLQIDARKWILSKMNPKKYGDRLEIEQTIEDKRKSVNDLFPNLDEGD